MGGSGLHVGGGQQIAKYTEKPGDCGRDTAGLGAHPTTTLEKYREAELIHARWAMLGNLGCTTLDLIAKYEGASPSPRTTLSWHRAAAFCEGGTDHWGEPRLVHTQSIVAILACQVLLVGAVEASRTAGAGPLNEG